MFPLLRFNLSHKKENEEENKEENKNGIRPLSLEEIIGEAVAAYAPDPSFHPDTAYGKAPLRSMFGLSLGAAAGASSEPRRTAGKSPGTLHSAVRRTDRRVDGLVYAISLWRGTREIQRKQGYSEDPQEIYERNILKYADRYEMPQAEVMEMTGKTAPANGNFSDTAAVGACTVGACFEDPEDVIRYAVTAVFQGYSHAESVRGAAVSAVAVWLACHGADKERIRDYVLRFYGETTGPYCYQFSHGFIPADASPDTIRSMPPLKTSSPVCMVTVPEAMSNFFSTDSFEQCLLRVWDYECHAPAVAAISGALAASYYRVEESDYREYYRFLPKEVRARLLPQK